MDALIKILGKRIDSPEAKEALADFDLACWDAENSGLPDEDQSLVDTAQGIEVQQTVDEIIETIFLFSHGHQGFARFSRPLAFGLSFFSTRDEVHRALGHPSTSGPANPRALLGPSGPWDRYDLQDGVVHFQYRYDRDAIALVTLMANGTAPMIDPLD